MSTNYTPGPAAGAHIDKDGDNWTLVLVRELHHPPEKVWEAITEPEHLRAWAPFDADKSLGEAGATVKLTTLGAPKEHITEITVSRAEKPHILEYQWSGNMRWQLEPSGTGTRLMLWHNINRNFISMGAAGWHVCFDVMDHYLSGDPIGRTVGPDAMKIDGWQRLHEEYANQLGVPMPTW
jgi:uncharacterized protein YndB with AHSA1/START domain